MHRTTTVFCEIGLHVFQENVANYILADFRLWLKICVLGSSDTRDIFVHYIPFKVETYQRNFCSKLGQFSQLSCFSSSCQGI